jgi:hypothetical protein
MAEVMVAGRGEGIVERSWIVGFGMPLYAPVEPAAAGGNLKGFHRSPRWALKAGGRLVGLRGA